MSDPPELYRLALLSGAAIVVVPPSLGVKETGRRGDVPARSLTALCC